MNQIKTDTELLKDEANASAVNAKASEDKAKEYADNLQASTDDISKLKEDLVANKKEDAKTKRSLSALWDLNNGISYRFETDSEKVYQKKVLSGAKLASVNKVGGKTIVMNQIFKIASISANGLTFSVDNDGLITINGTASSYFATLSQINDLQNKEGKFFAKMTIVENPNTVEFKFGYTNRNKFTDAISSGSTSTIFTQTNAELAKAKYQGITGFQEGTVFNNVKVKIMIFDLTKMFGSGNEPTTPEEFEAMLPNDYYPYNEGELMSMSVNDVVEKGRNLCDCYGFSSKGILNINDKRELANNRGTTISTIEPINRVIATQAQAPNGDNVISDNNGYFCIGVKGMKPSKSYVFSFDFTPTKMLLESNKLAFLVNGRLLQDTITIDDLNVKKRVAIPIKYGAVDDRQYIEIRLGGMSGIFENFQLDEGSTETAYTPYYTPISYTIPQAILELDGYGASGNYVDFAKKEYHKGDEIIDISDIIGDTFQEPFEVENGGSLTFKNTNGDGYQIAVPSDIQYVVSLSEVNA